MNTNMAECLMAFKHISSIMPYIKVAAALKGVNVLS